MVLNEEQQLSEDNFSAALAKMNNLIRNDLIQRINSLPFDAYTEKERYAKVFRPYFVQTHQNRLFHQFGHVAQEQKTELLLTHYKKQLLDDWSACLNRIDLNINKQEIEQLDQTISQIIVTSLPFCKPSHRSSGQAIDQETETEIQKENQVLIEQNKELEKETQPQQLHPKSFRAWKENDVLQFVQDKPNPSLFIPLNQHNPKGDHALFTETLLISINQALTYSRQDKMFDYDLKPVHAILFVQIAQEIKACLISNEEAKKFAGILQSERFKEIPIWISTTQQTLLEGHRPSDVLNNEHYKSLLEQIRFFNGEFGLLYRQKEPFQWLSQNTNHKLQFYQKNISRHRLSQMKDFAAFEAKVSCLLVGLRHLNNHRYKPLEINWEKLFPEALDNDRKTLMHLSQAFDEVNKNDFTAPALDMNALLQTYALPIDTINDLKTHIDIHNGRKRFWQRLQIKPNFEKIPVATVDTCLTLMHIISGEPTSRQGLDSANIRFFFNQIENLTSDEWLFLIKSQHCTRILDALSLEQFIKLLVKAIDKDQQLLPSILGTLDFPKKLALIKSNEMSIENKARIISSSRYMELFHALPQKQFKQILLHILNKENLAVDELKQLAVTVNYKPLKRKLITQPLALSFLINQIGSNNTRNNHYRSHLKGTVLNKLHTSLASSNGIILIKQMDPDYILQTIQAICEYKNEPLNVFWQAHSVNEYKQWLNKFHAGNLFITNNPPITTEQLKALSLSNEPLQLLLDWQIKKQGPCVDNTINALSKVELSSFDSYLEEIEELQKQYPAYKTKLQSLISDLKTAKEGPADQFDTRCRSAIDKAKIEFEQEPGLWGLCKPILNKILQFLKRINLYQGTFFVSEITKSWEEQHLDDVTKKNDTP